MVEITAIAACAILAGLSVFQIALIFGAPLGRFAWGGQHHVLPVGLRIASLSSVALYALFSMVVLGKSKLIALPIADSTLGIGVWILTAYFSLGILMNALSRSKPERMVMTPAAAMLALLFLFVATQ